MRNKIPVTVISSDEQIPVNRVNWPFMELEIDQNFKFPLNKRSSVQSRVTNLNKTTDRKFIVRKIDETNGGVWRVE